MADAFSPPLDPYDPTDLGPISPICPVALTKRCVRLPTPPSTDYSDSGSVDEPLTPTPSTFSDPFRPTPQPQPPPQCRYHPHPASIRHAAPIAPAPHGYQPDPDEFSLSDSFTMHSSGSMSVTSTVYAHTIENGRRFQHFKHGRYPMPNDDDEMERENIKHLMLLELLGGELFYAPIGDNPRSILDVGTGSGAWAIEMGDRFPGAHVRGMDLSPVQPSLVPPNVDFLIDDCEGDEEWLSHNVDFVHLRFMTIVLKDVPGTLRRAYQSLRPGGWIELQELCAEPLCDDGTMPSDDPVKELYDLTRHAFACFGMNTTLPKELGPMLAAAGFVNVQCELKKVPIGTWARNATLRAIGLYQKEAVLQVMPVLATRPFRALGLSEAQSQMTLAMARDGMNNVNVHRYFPYYFWFAQKPEAT